MKTQISRNSYQSDQDYNGVYQQQGRMLTDADWNELSDIQKIRLIRALKDVLASGASKVDGLAINPDGTINPGLLYVDGWPARLNGAAPLPADAQPDYPKPPTFSGKNLILYADVWERPITSLEDEQLIDTALHGADTCTRSRTVLQIKWCSKSNNPDNPNQNPSIGTALLKLKLRQITVSDDPCDPCSTQLNLAQQVGNYLFRVEVHDHYQKNGDEFLVLKWSRDNGAEAYKTAPVDELPAGFATGSWVWEFFDLETEKLMGNHYPPGFRAKRGELLSSFAVPTGNKAKDFVRQWDGFCVLNLTGASVVEGMDRGVALKTTLGPQSHGRVDLSTDTFKVNLEHLELEMDIAGRQFLAGDYWQAPVRESSVKSGDYVLGNETAGTLPAGIKHHYLRLARLDGAGSLIPQTDAEKRQFNFPPLTDIRASDVGLTNTCPGLYGSAENMQEALDNLCFIDAADIAYQEPGCPESIRELLAKVLPDWPDLDKDGKISLKDMLDGLLCHLSSQTLPHEVPSCGDEENPTVRFLLDLEPGVQDTAGVIDALLCDMDASDIPLNKTKPICTELDMTDIKTVQDALKRLCTRTGGGCVVPVAPGELESRFKEFQDSAAESAWFCLQPGTHVLPANLTLKGKNAFKITGAGSTASVIQFKGTVLSIEFSEIHLEDIGLTFSNGQGQLQLACDNVSAAHNLFYRSGQTIDAPAMVNIILTGEDEGALHWMDNSMTSYWWQVVQDGVKEIAPSETAGVDISSKLAALLKEEKTDKAAMDALAKEVVDMPAAKKTSWREAATANMANLDFGSPSPRIRTGSSRTFAAAGSADRVPLISAPGAAAPMDAGDSRAVRLNHADVAMNAMDKLTNAATAENAARAIEDLILALRKTGYNTAMHIDSPNMAGRLEGNRLFGELHFGNGANKAVDPVPLRINAVSVEGKVVHAGREMHLHGNEIYRLVSLMESGVVKERVLQGKINGYGTLYVSDNVFLESENSLIAGQILLHGNHFAGEDEQKEAALLLANQLIIIGNIGHSRKSSLRYHADDQETIGNVLMTTAF